MHEGSWTIRPCAYGEVAALAGELGVSEITASVLVRRGYADPDAARAFLAGELPPHDPFAARRHARGVRPDPRRDRRRHADLRPRRLRRRRHLRDRARGARRCASSAPTSAGTCRAASRRATASSGETLARLAEEGFGLVLTVDCGITAVEEVAAARAARARRDRHRPPPAGRGAARLPDRRDAALEYPFPELCGTGVVYKLARGAARRRATRRSPATSTSSRSRRSPTSSRSSTRTARSRSRGCARSRRTQAGPAGADASRAVDPAAVDASGGRLPARAADQRRRPSRPARRRARAAPDRGRGGSRGGSPASSRS